VGNGSIQPDVFPGDIGKASASAGDAHRCDGGCATSHYWHRHSTSLESQKFQSISIAIMINNTIKNEIKLEYSAVCVSNKVKKTKKTLQGVKNIRIFFSIKNNVG
jgi:hypothetical protein